jgi:hypothetical protein
MLNLDDLPGSAATLICHADAARERDEVLMIAEIFLACTHPDFLMSPAATRLLQPGLRIAVAEFLREVLIDGLTEHQRASLFTWAQEKMLARPGLPRSGG